MEKIKLITVKDYCKYWEVSKNTAAVFYYRDLSYLYEIQADTTAYVSNGYITTLGFLRLYTVDFVFVDFGQKLPNYPKSSQRG